MSIAILDHDNQPKDVWRAGVLTRMCASAVTGTTQLTIFEQWCDPGLGAPTHLHAVEEVLSVLAGKAEVWIGSEKTQLVTGQSVVIPAGRKHGFRNAGNETLHMRAILASPIFEAAYDDARETPRRWVPEAP